MLSKKHTKFLSFIQDPKYFNSILDKLDYALKNGGVNNGVPLTHPTFIDKSNLYHISQINTGLAELIKSIPTRLFQNNMDEYLDAVGGNIDLDKDSLSYGIENIQSIITRGDFIHAEDSFKCLEFNFGLYVGGWQSSFVEELYLREPEISEYLVSENIDILRYNTLSLAVEHFYKNTLTWLNDTFSVINFVITRAPNSSLDEYSLLEDLFYKILPESIKGNVFLIENLSQLKIKKSYVHLGKHRIHGILNFAFQENKNILEAYSNRIVNFFHSPISYVLALKSNLAILSENSSSSVFTNEEQSLIEKHIPWTRILKRGSMEYQKNILNMEQLCIENKDKLVLKENFSFSGKGVYIGKETSEEEWVQLLKDNMDLKNCIVQEYYESCLYPYLDVSGVINKYRGVWGLFSFDNSHGGGFLRLLSDKKSAVINAGQGAMESYFIVVDESL